MSDLEILKQHRNALLLAEAVGWLHDYRKCSEAHLQTLSANTTGQGIPRNQLAQNQPTLSTTNLQLLGLTRSLTNLLDDRTWQNDALGQYLSRCHNTAHFDKQEPSDGKQNYPGTQISSPFGFESAVASNLTSSMWGLPWSDLTNIAAQRNNLREKVSALFSSTVADSRRSINEIDLWNWGVLVGALYKSALAAALLAGLFAPQMSHLRWRLLGVRVNGLEYLSEVIRVPDLLARKEILSDALNRVKTLLEEQYPIASEVYRDENGSLYIVPDIPNLLKLQDGSGNTLETLLRQEFSRGTVKGNDSLELRGELLPDVTLESQSWWGQDPNWPRTNNDQLADISGMLSKTVIRLSDVAAVQGYWQSSQNGEICPVCRLRPQGPGQKARDRKVCDVCEQRRADRAKDWTKNLHTTIWIDEVADANGRLALIVGCFGLERWLDGTMVQTLVVNEPQNGQAVTQNPTFARLRRIWETTRKFWQELQTTELPRRVPAIQERQQITLQSCTNPQGEDCNLEDAHTYDLLVNGVRVSVVWDGTRFLTAGNLAYLAKPEQLGKPLDQLLTPGASFDLEEPTGYGSKNKVLGKVTVQSVQTLTTPYTPAIPLLTEPRTFMALVPADRALEVIKAIRCKYEVEMGKVRNRLPLTLGAVFFPRKTPLAAAIESGRRMLAFQTESQVWKVQSVVQKNDPNTQDHHRKQTVELTLERDGREVKLSIPVMMDDGATLDVWYPYWRVRSKHSKGRWFKFTGGCWVHICELQKDDFVRFTPSTFDFEYLDTTARRFEVTYQSGQRRDPAKRQRPYLLEELDGLNATWEAVRCLSKSQIYALDALIETKRQEWAKPIGLEALRLPADDPFRQLVRDALHETGLSPDLESAALRGWLRDALELHLEILKE